MGQLNAKLGQLEKARCKIQGDIDEMAAQADQAHISTAPWRRKPSNLTELLANGSKRLTQCQWTWILLKRNAEMHLLNFSESSLPMMSLSFSWMKSGRKIRA